MEHLKDRIIKLLIGRGHTAIEESEKVWALINGIKTEWNWFEDSIIIGFGNDKDDINRLMDLVPSKFDKERTYRNNRPINVIYINRQLSSTENFKEIVELIVNSKLELSKKAKPQTKKAIQIHKPQSTNFKTKNDLENGKDQIDDNLIPPSSGSAPNGPGIGPDSFGLPGHVNILEKFLQYGDLRNADIVYMGYEEGLWEVPEPYATEISVYARMLLHECSDYQPYRNYINKENDNEGWYINENGIDDDEFSEGILAHATQAAITACYPLVHWNPPAVNVINMQHRLHWLLQPGNRDDNYRTHHRKLYNGLNHHSGRHMIDFYPFPKRSKKDWPPFYTLNTNLPAKTQYYNHYDNPGNNRWELFKGLYNKMRMPLTVSYAGKKNKNFLLLNFFKDVGFTFNTDKYGRLITNNTGVINPAYSGPITGSHKPKDFLIGHRLKKDGQKQIVVLTPFLGNGQFGYHDIDPLSTWL